MVRARLDLCEHCEQLSAQVTILHPLVDLTVLVQTLIKRLQLLKHLGTNFYRIFNPGSSYFLCLYGLNQVERSLADEPQDCGMLLLFGRTVGLEQIRLAVHVNGLTKLQLE